MSSPGPAPTSSGTTGVTTPVKHVRSVATEVLDLPPSCLEFSPKHLTYFVIGTYDLEKEVESKPVDEVLVDNLQNIALQGDEDSEKVASTEGNAETKPDAPTSESLSKPEDAKSQTRSGSLLLYRIENDELILVHAVTYPSAILDLHFSPYQPDDFIVASSTGSVSLYTLQMDPRPAVVHKYTYQLSSPSTLILSVSWHRSFPGLFGATLSTGKVGIYQFSPTDSLMATLKDDLSDHGENAWTLAFSPTHDPKYAFRTQGVYSGGDDYRLRCITLNQVAHLKVDSRVLSESSTGGLMGMGGHEYGITAILPLPFDTEAGKDILITGCYDDKVRVYATYDYRPDAPTTHPKTLAELNLGGGVWRLKFLDDYPTVYESLTADSEPQLHSFRILASCMHAGARVLEVSGSKRGDWTIKILSVFDEHKSMCYASDVQPGGHGDRAALCVSSSFYDKLLCLWRFKEPGRRNGTHSGSDTKCHG